MTVKLKDVAAYAAVSIKTVSNVVNEQPFVAPETRQRVQEAIAHLGYRPNLVARHMRKARVGVLALAIPDLANTYFSDIGNAIIAAAAEHGCTVLLDHTGGQRAQEQLIVQGLRQHLIDGIILSPDALQMEDLSSERTTVPLVLIGEQLFGTPWDHVAIDNVAAARQATEHLISLGRRRVAFMTYLEEDIKRQQRSPEMGASNLRLHGYTEALTAAGLPIDPNLMILGPSVVAGRQQGAEAMRRLLALDRPPDAVFCFNDLMALGAKRMAYDCGLRVPDDIAIVGFDDIEEGHYSIPSLTTISPDKQEIGRLAVSLLIDRITGRRSGPAEKFTPSFQLIVRESTVGQISAVSSPTAISSTTVSSS